MGSLPDRTSRPRLALPYTVVAGRDAVHLAYWCGIAFLEAEGAWKTDPSRTPREYLRLLAPASARVAPLAALTRSFERVWYGTDRADGATYDEAVSELRKLGCPSL